MVHAAMPRSLEEYVQQIGRAGRDGEEARCVLLLDKDVFLKLRSLSHSDGADNEAVEALVHKVSCPGLYGMSVCCRWIFAD